MVDPEQGGPAAGDPAAGRWRRELRNHPVIRVAGAYCVVAWVLMQAGEIILPSFDAPAWIMQTLIAALVAGLPVVIILARITRIHTLIGLPEPAPSPIAFSRKPDAEQEVGDILRLRSASLDVPMDLSESRQVTTLVCSLVGWRDDREDPELLLGFLAGMERDIAAAVSRYEGTRLPSGRNEIVVAFGFPLAHEDDARRAAKLATDLLALVHEHDIADGPGTRVTSRAGLHTSTIIVDEGASDDDVMNLLGDTVGVAAYLQALAPEEGVALSAASQFLLRSAFLLEELSRQTHPRLGRDVPVFELGREITGELASVMVEQSEIFGREHERSLLLQQWRTVLEGESEYALIKGEPGMGKTSLLVNTVRELVAGGGGQLMLLTCEPYHRDTPFRPLVSFLERNVFGGKRLSYEQRVAKLEAFVGGVLEEGETDAVPLLSALLSNNPEEATAGMDSSSKRVREQTLALLVSLMERFAARAPLVLAVEDLQWADPSTRDLIDHLVATDPAAPIFGLFTARPEFEPAWVNQPDVIEINLNKLPGRVADDMIRRASGDTPLAPELVRQIIDHAAGIPLYIEQLTRSVLESHERQAGHAEGQLDVPASLKASLAARIDHLGPAKPLLQLCSVIGFEFNYALLRAVCEDSDEKLLRKVLGSIVSAGLIYQKGAIPEATFKFKHRLIMEVASQSLLRRTRQHLHRVIAEKLESRFPERCETRPNLVAHHFSRAGQPGPAIRYWIRAAQLSQAKFANEEASAQIQRGLAALKDVADEEQRDQLEITLQNLMGQVQLATQGYTNPEVRVAFERALELSERVAQTPELFRMIVGLWMYYVIRGEYDRALELSGQLQQMAEQMGEAPELLQANYCAGYAHYFRGDVSEALAFFDRAQAHADGDFDYARQTPSRDDSRVHLNCLHALALWVRGDSKAAQQAADRALAMAREQGHPYVLTWSLFWTTWLEHMRGDLARAAELAGEMVEICQSRGFSFFIPLGLFFRACVIPDPAERLENLLAMHQVTMGTGARNGSAYLRSVIIRELIDQGELQRARQLADENTAYIEAHSEWLFSSENQRLQALLARDLDGDTEACARLLEQGITQAQAVNNLPFALRCALALHELPQAGGQAKERLKSLVAAHVTDDDTGDFLRARAIVADAGETVLTAGRVSG